MDPQLFNGSALLDGSGNLGSGATRCVEALDAAIVRFGTWFSLAHADGGLDMSSHGVLHALPPVSDRFCVGLWGFRFYMAAPPDAADWMACLPLSHVVADAEKSTLALHCEHVAGRSKSLPAFTLSFEVSTRDYLLMLSTHSFIDVRVARSNAAASEGIEISREVLLSLPIHAASQGTLGARNRVAPGAAHQDSLAADTSNRSNMAHRRI